MTPVFITYGTGYMGRWLIKQLVGLGYPMFVFVHLGSENKLPHRVKAIVSNAFNVSPLQKYFSAGAVFVQRLTVTHSSPRKVLFRRIDRNND